MLYFEIIQTLLPEGGPEKKQRCYIFLFFRIKEIPLQKIQVIKVSFCFGERESGERPELYLQLYFPECVRCVYATGEIREGVTDGKSQKTCLPRSEWPSLRNKSLGNRKNLHDEKIYFVRSFGPGFVRMPEHYGSGYLEEI